MRDVRNPTPTARFRLAEIARELKLSVSTVSRALSGVGRVSDETRRRVVAAAQRLHNQSHLAVVPAVMNRMIGFLMPWYGATLGMGTSIAHLAQDAVRSVCDEQGYGLMYNSFGGPNRTVADDLLESGALAGALLYRTKNEPTLAQTLKSRRIPHIFTYRNLAGTSLNYVGIDHGQAMRLALEHCVEAGYRRIGIILGDTTFPSHAAFESAFRAEAGRLRAEFRPEWVVSGPVTEESGQSLAAGLLKHGGPRALVCTSDRIALGVLKAAHDAGRSVPKDVAILTIDGTPSTAFSRPALTAVVIPWQPMFTMATQLLLQIIQSPSTVDQVGIQMRCELVVRESTVVAGVRAVKTRSA